MAIPFIYLKGKVAKPLSQNDESEIIASLLTRFKVPKTFIELGFGGWEFNCASLAYDWQGLLLDGDRYNVRIANTILPKKITAEHLWLTQETIVRAIEYAEGKDVGILSIDVDGNDYWFLKRLISIRPAIIICEYNSIMGHRSLTVPYDPNFNYRNYPTIFYGGASLKALAKLTAWNGYSLIAMQSKGINAFFVRNDLLGPDDKPLDPDEAWVDAGEGDGRTPEDRWQEIKDLPFVAV